jgi:hypothetical protein
MLSCFLPPMIFSKTTKIYKIAHITFTMNIRGIVCKNSTTAKIFYCNLILGSFTSTNIYSDIPVVIKRDGDTHNFCTKIYMSSFMHLGSANSWIFIEAKKKNTFYTLDMFSANLVVYELKKPWANAAQITLYVLSWTYLTWTEFSEILREHGMSQKVMIYLK